MDQLSGTPESSKEIGSSVKHTENQLTQGSLVTTSKTSASGFDELRHITLGLLQRAAQDEQNRDQATEMTFEKVVRTTQMVNDLISIAERFNEISAISESRSPHIGFELMPLVYAKIVELSKKEKESSGQRKELDVKHRYFAVALQKNFLSAELTSAQKLPSWLEPITGQFRLLQIPSNLPDCLTYLKYSPMNEGRAKIITEELNKLKNEERRLGAKHQNTDNAKGIEKQREEIFGKIENLHKKATEILNEATDIRLPLMHELTSVLEVKLLPTAEVVTLCLKFYNSLGNFLKTVALQPGFQVPESISILNTSIKNKRSLSLTEQSINVAEVTSEEQLCRALPLLVQGYNSLRNSLYRLHQSVVLDGGSGNDVVATVNELGSALSQVFPGSLTESAACISALSNKGDPALKREVAELLTAQIIARGSQSSFEPDFLIAKPEGSRLVGEFAQAYIFEFSAAQIKATESLKTGYLSSLVAFCHEVRTQIEQRNYDKLADIFDDKIKNYTQPQTSVSYLDKVGVLAAMAAVAAHEPVAKLLRSRLRGVESVSTLCDVILKDKQATSSEVASIVDRSRVEILKGLSSTLKDYRGHFDLKTQVCTIIDKNLKLLKTEEQWRGIPKKLALLNGLLFYGIPGAGKSFFVKCLANEYGFPLINITREEMIGGEKGKSTAPSGLDVRIDEFLKTKIEEARKQMRLNKAPTSIIFIDEMEAQFLRRNPMTSTQLEIDETNKMLRVLEAVMERNPDLLFVAATNHIEFVDPAALRIGRFGIHLELRAVSKGDAEDLLKSVGEYLGIDSEALVTDSRFNELVSLCEGMVPRSLMNYLINSYLVADNTDQQSIVEIFIETMKNMKSTTWSDKHN
jgi:SpoVK/Ycf46/Vps4 family AAA+-type ATPase